MKNFKTFYTPLKTKKKYNENYRDSSARLMWLPCILYISIDLSLFAVFSSFTPVAMRDISRLFVSVFSTVSSWAVCESKK